MPASTAPARGHDVYQSALDNGAPTKVPHCPQCNEAMTHLRLPGHLHGAVDIDHCRPCGLVWFDAMESVQLTGLGWIRLLRELQLGATTDRPVVERLCCPLCQRPLRPVRNATRFGRFPALECTACHGHLHSQAGMLAERGLVRPSLPIERKALREERRQLCCLNCGAPSDGQGDQCRYCTTPLLMFDVPRLQQAVRVRSEGEGPSTAAAVNPAGTPVVDAPTATSTAPPATPLAWACRACGSALDPGVATRCDRCAHPVVVPSLLDLAPLLSQLERDWHQQAQLREASLASRRASYRSTGAAPRSAGRRTRSWRDTALARIFHHMAADDHSRWDWSGPPAQVLGWAGVLLVLVLIVTALMH